MGCIVVNSKEGKERNIGMSRIKNFLGEAVVRREWIQQEIDLKEKRRGSCEQPDAMGASLVKGVERSRQPPPIGHTECLQKKTPSRPF
jgi:hypothetical protein